MLGKLKRFWPLAAFAALVTAGTVTTATLTNTSSTVTPSPVTVVLSPTPISVPYAVGTQSGTYTAQGDPMTTSVNPVTDTVTQTATVTAPPPSGYTPPTPSASVMPGEEFTAGVEPFVAAGLTLTKVGANTLVPGVAGLSSDANGNITVTQAGAHLDALWLAKGYINVKAPDVTISQSLIEGYNNTTLTANRGLINATGSTATGLVVKDTTLDLGAGYAATPWNGITGHDFTALRVKVRNTTDGFGIFNTASPYMDHVVIDGCDVDQLTYTSPDPNHSSDTPISHSHNDAVQIQGAAPGSSIEIRYSRLNGQASDRGQILDSPTNPDAVSHGYNVVYPYLQSMSAIMVTPNVAQITGLDVHNNWLDGGAVTVNIRNTINYKVGQFVNNKFGRFQRQDINPPYVLTLGKAAVTAGTVVSGNVYDDDGSSVLWHAY